MKKLAFAGIAVALMLILTGIASAYSYNLTVPAFNGSARTYNLPMNATNGVAHINMQEVGGDYRVDARFEDISNNGLTGWNRMGDGSYFSATLYRPAGTQVHACFSNDWTTYVSVQVIGTWWPG